jgi:hypothetical protein
LPMRGNFQTFLYSHPRGSKIQGSRGATEESMKDLCLYLDC